MLTMQLHNPDPLVILLGIVAFGALIGWPYIWAFAVYCRRCWHAARRLKRHHRL